MIEDYVIDCDAVPLTTPGFNIKEHQKGGKLIWDKNSQKDALFLSDAQQAGRCETGHKIRRELVGRSALNANVIEYLLAHTHLIPDNWRDVVVFFYGTIYTYNQSLYVRYLCYVDGVWTWNYGRLSKTSSKRHPAALRAD